MKKVKVKVKVTLHKERATIEGPHGTDSCRAVDPLEIGIRVLELGTGNKVCPPTAYHGRDK